MTYDLEGLGAQLDKNEPMLTYCRRESEVCCVGAGAGRKSNLERSYLQLQHFKISQALKKHKAGSTDFMF